MATTYTLAELLSWMKDQDRMSKWDAIVAMERNKTNLLLIQNYIDKFSLGSYIPSITGAIATGGIGGSFREYIQDFVMDVPRLYFEDTGLDNSKANLRMAVVAGRQVSIEKDVTVWHVTRILDYDPLDGPSLFLDLLLPEVSGEIADNGNIRLDLSKSDNFRLTFAETQTEQELAGRVFKALFNRLDDEQRVWTLGTIKRGSNPMMQPRSFGLRTQRGGQEGEGAMLAFVRMEGRHEGDFPGASSGFRYLIPNDAGRDYSATVLVGRGRVVIAELVRSLGEMIDHDDFDYVFDDDNRDIVVTAKGGGIKIPRGTFNHRLEMTTLLGPIWADLEVSHPEFLLAASERLKVELHGQQISVRWLCAGTVRASMNVVATNYEGLQELIDIYPSKSLYYHLTVTAYYQLIDDGAGGTLKRIRYDVESNVDPESGVDIFKFGDAVKRKLSLADPVDPIADLVGKLLILMGLLMVQAAEVLLNLLATDASGMIAGAIKEQFPTGRVVSGFIAENLALNYGETIQMLNLQSPYDVGLFGRINPAQTTFAITTPEPRIAAGTPHYAFEVFPERTGLKWTVGDLQRRAVSAGTIDENTGVYTPPAASQIEGRFTRVRVTATDPVTQFSSSALVTVVRSRLTINPLIQICDKDERVPLKLGYLKDDEDSPAPTVVINNPVPGESGSIESNNGVYTYVSNKEVVEGKTYVMDELVATYKGYTASVYMVVTQTTPAITIQVPDSLKGLTEVALRAIANNRDITEHVEWSIDFNGPGSWHSETPGVYKVDEMAPQAFVFIKASWDSVVIGVLEGHLLLALPLLDIPDVPLSVAETDGETGLAY
ncbi:hypothetical protein [Pseudomonas sp. NFACC05-1]|uniref:hypothetical protein n=1 Tax=Pseudomonas sp. NFACC05-1 TaxID=1566241 RepID=UPI0008719851|nr:hypothetical protein [Pseudomonas sp. NFACC05-1]SCW94853.1 hypothetical protein SAMN03159424_04915 [Pseudomonas sp. NFACC05-1]